MASAQGKQVPAKMRETYEAVVALTDAFCRAHLNEEYADLARTLTATLCRKRPSPLAQGRPKTWACGIVYALGQVNFLFDKSQDPYLSATDVCAGFGVSQASASSKAKTIRDALDLMPLDPRWSLPSRLDDNPLVWMLEVNGFILDVRSLPRSVQIEAYERGLIPYLPHERLIQEMEAALPLPVHPTLTLCEALREKGFEHKPTDTLTVSHVFDGGDVAGITCVLAETADENLGVSLTFLRPVRGHPLAEKIDRYRQQRAAGLAWEREEG